jgi:outer membrane lipoprotein-sorting protein
MKNLHWINIYQMIKQFLLITLFITNSYVIFGQDYKLVPDKKAVETQLNNASAKTSTIICDFIQEKHLESLDETIISKGKFWFKKENKLRWEYAVPFKYLILINNGKFTIKDGTKVSEYDVNSNKAFKEINDIIISSIRGTLSTDGKFDIIIYQNATTYKVQLTPKDAKMKKIINKTELYFDKKDLTVSKVIIIENESDYTVISFINKKLNESILDTVFTTK